MQSLSIVRPQIEASIAMCRLIVCLSRGGKRAGLAGGGFEFSGFEAGLHFGKEFGAGDGIKRTRVHAEDA
jgi:hypothetical protein